ncbi:hypothetical protein Dda_6813 [Drechslerella dactyloides]|uniref:OTU domain-containing protein n=1 Tax=Drechslerella dactyloides TaxID=74499 RepID=A0AAD6NHR5_DREDA|nr:hypothetical protein Dda_6813 [Drechslerella dactyloides]
MSDEFPLLAGLGLYASDIIGDGDCLFRSLSDQLYGHQSKAHEIRSRTTSYMRTHASYFKLFLSVAPTRRKKNAANTAAPSEDAVDRAFADHVNRMEKAGVYGDNLEIVAFARCYGVNVKIYQREFAYQISCDGDEDVPPSAANDGSGGEPQLLHIAYHSWEHYSSVRNVDGPHTGHPVVSPRTPTEDDKRRQKEVLGRDVAIMPWMEKVVAASLPNAVPAEKVREMLVKCKADVGMAVSRLLDELSEDEEEGKGEDPAAADESEKVDDGTVGGATKAGEEAPAVKGKGKAKAKDKATAKAFGKTDRPAQQASDDKHASKQPSTRPKRETARERKDRQQREKMERKKTKTSGGKGKTASADQPAAAVSEGIKTLHV